MLYNVFMRKLIFIVLMLGFFAIYYFSTGGSSAAGETSFVRKTISNVVNLVKKSTNAATGAANLSIPTSDSAAAVIKKDNENLQLLTPEKLHAWITDQARTMDSTGNDSEQIQIRLRAEAQT